MLTKDQQLRIDASMGLRIVHPTVLDQCFANYCADHPDKSKDSYVDYCNWLDDQLDEGTLIEKQLSCYTIEYYDVVDDYAYYNYR